MFCWVICLVGQGFLEEICGFMVLLSFRVNFLNGEGIENFPIVIEWTKRSDFQVNTVSCATSRNDIGESFQLALRDTGMVSYQWIVGLNL